MSYPPPSMRTGFNNLIDPSQGKITPDSPTGKKLLSLVFVLIKRAAESAAVYCKHSGRDLVTPDDVRLALKYHTHRFFIDDGLEEEFEEMHTFLESELKDNENLTDGVDTLIDALEEEEDEEEEDGIAGLSGCACDLCHGMTSFDWDAWEPEDPAEIFMKQCMENTMRDA